MATTGIVGTAIGPTATAATVGPTPPQIDTTIMPIDIAQPSTKPATVSTPAPNSTPAAVSTPAAAPATSSYTPSQIAETKPWTVDSSQTVSGNVDKLIAQDGPQMQSARTAALQAMNSRGLVNSSMAVGAAQKAVIDTATPIAASDAATYSKAAGYNTDVANTANTTNVAAQNTAQQFNAQQSNAMLSQQVDNQTRIQLQDLQSRSSTLLNTNSTASALFGQATSALNNIATSTTMDQATKQSQSAAIYANLQKQLQVIGSTSGLDLAGVLGGNPYTA
jgi:hypothetical protein